MKKYLLSLLTFFVFFNCNFSGDKLSCYSDYLRTLKDEQKYKIVCESFDKQATSLKNQDGFYVYHPEYVKNVLRDDAVFFNHKGDKCLILLLQQTADDLKLDQIQIIQGTLEGGLWEFATDRLPEVPNVVATIHKPSSDKKNANNSFKKISDEGRSFVLTAGNTVNGGCEIDEKYWFGK